MKDGGEVKCENVQQTSRERVSDAGEHRVG